MATKAEELNEYIILGNIIKPLVRYKGLIGYLDTHNNFVETIKGLDEIIDYNEAKEKYPEQLI